MRDEKSYLRSTIHMLEDKLLMSTNIYEQDELTIDLRKLRKRLQTLEWQEQGRA